MSPVQILDLPPELIHEIIEAVDGPNYTDKERQADLASFSLVHSAFRSPAQNTLYHSPAVRNAGRAYLLLRTLSKSDSSDLAPLVRGFSFRNNTLQDHGHPGTTTAILRVTNPTSLTLGSRLFSPTHGGAVDDLRGVVRGKDIRSFSYGFHQASNVYGRISDFLLAWPNLEDLSLTFFDLQLAYPGPVSSPDPPPPAYTLTSLTLTHVYIKPLPPLSLSWVLGATTTSLRSLSLSAVTFNNIPATESDLFPLLPAHLASLRHLALLNLTWLNPLGVVLSSYPSRANAILKQCPALRSFSLEAVAQDGGVDGDVMDPLELPKGVRELEVRGKRLFRRVRVKEVVEKGEGALEEVTLVGPTGVGEGVQELGRACRVKGIVFRTRFAP